MKDLTVKTNELNDYSNLREFSDCSIGSRMQWAPRDEKMNFSSGSTVWLEFVGQKKKEIYTGRNSKICEQFPQNIQRNTDWCTDVRKLPEVRVRTIQRDQNSAWCTSKAMNSIFQIEKPYETSLVVQQLRFSTSNAGDLGLVPGQGSRPCMLQLKILHAATKIPHAEMKMEDPPPQKKKENGRSRVPKLRPSAHSECIKMS